MSVQADGYQEEKIHVNTFDTGQVLYIIKQLKT